jgi:small subunit ribosomal protein S20
MCAPFGGQAQAWPPAFDHIPDHLFGRFSVALLERETDEHMANTPQAKKRIRRNARRADINTARVSRIRTFIKKVEAACETGDKEAAAAALKAAQPEMARGVSRGVMHKNTVARKMSRLTRRVAAL